MVFTNKYDFDEYDKPITKNDIVNIVEQALKLFKKQ